jgi:hypothetical protein
MVSRRAATSGTTTLNWHARLVLFWPRNSLLRLPTTVGRCTSPPSNQKWHAPGGTGPPLADPPTFSSSGARPVSRTIDRLTARVSATRSPVQSIDRSSARSVPLASSLAGPPQLGLANGPVRWRAFVRNLTAVLCVSPLGFQKCYRSVRFFRILPNFELKSLTRY